MSGFCLCLFLWDATLEERQSFNPCINDSGVLLPKDYHFYPFCTSTFDPFTCTHPIAKSPHHPRHTDAQLIFNSGTSCRSTHVKSENVCALCMSRFVWHDQRCLCRRDRNDNPFVSKLSNHLFMDWYSASAETEYTSGRERGGEREGWHRKTKNRSIYKDASKHYIKIFTCIIAFQVYTLDFAWAGLAWMECKCVSKKPWVYLTFLFGWINCDSLFFNCKRTQFPYC